MSYQEKTYPEKLPLGSFNERYSLLFSGKKTIVYIKNEFDDSTFRYRYFNIREAFSSQDCDVHLTCFLVAEIPFILKHIDSVDLFVLQRATWDPLVDTMMYVASAKGVPVYYDIDDCIYQGKYAVDYIYSLGVRDIELQNHLILYSGKIETVLRKVDQCIVSNRVLGKKIEQDIGIPCHFVRNGFNLDQKEASITALSQKKEICKNKFVIGYFSGSPSHNNDFRQVEHQLIRLMKKYENIHLKIVGFINLSEEWDRSGIKHKVDFEPKVTYQQLQYKIAEVDVNIVPLVPTEFNDCKSELKFFEAALVNVVTCASPAYAYRNVIRNGENGFLCVGEDWYSTIENIYLGKVNLKNIEDYAYRTAVENYDYKCIRSEYMQLLGLIN